MDNKFEMTINQLVRSNIRDTMLIANFVNGYVAGWFMAVKEAFRNELDIKYTDRVVVQTQSDGTRVKKKIREWTQGPRFAFVKGQIFYDTPKAYLPWHKALKYIKICCEIVSAKPNEVIKIEDEKQNKKKNMLIEGWVEFTVYKPNETMNKLIPDKTHKLSQNLFVYFLKTGQIV